LISDGERKWSEEIDFIEISNKSIAKKIISIINGLKLLAFKQIIVSPLVKSKTISSMMILSRVDKLYTAEYIYKESPKKYTVIDIRKMIIGGFEIEVNVNPNERIYIGQPYEEVLDGIVKNRRDKYRDAVLDFNPTLYILHPKEDIKEWLNKDIQIRYSANFEKLRFNIKKNKKSEAEAENKINWGCIDSSSLLSLSNQKIIIYKFASDGKYLNYYTNEIISECIKSHNTIKVKVI
jgi:hypothetical protein